MAIPINPLPDLSQYNYVIGDTVDVVTKQNAINAEIEALGQNINATVASINTDVQAVEDAEQNLNAAQIVHAPGSGLANEAGTAYAEDAATLLDRVNHTGTQTLVTISDAGTAASSDVTTSATDTTSGRLMKVGDFGVGATRLAAYEVADLDATLIPTGIIGRVVGAAESPTGDRQVGLNIQWESLSEVHASHQMMFASPSYGINAAPRIFVRHKRENMTPAIGVWRELYHTGNILGTVSQSGGVPTGAIIERGSNANGEYVKFADGTLILFFPRQTVDVTTAQGAGYTSSQINMVYPLQPSNLVSNQGIAGSCSASHCFLAQKVLSTSITVSVKSFVSVSTAVFDVCLIGRWV